VCWAAGNIRRPSVARRSDILDRRPDHRARYPTNAVAGDSGYYVNAELHYNWSALLKGLDTYIFTDWAPCSPPFRDRGTESVGGGFSWTFAPSLTLEASYATPLKLAVSTQRHYRLIRASRSGPC